MLSASSLEDQGVALAALSLEIAALFSEIDVENKGVLKLDEFIKLLMGMLPTLSSDTVMKLIAQSNVCIVCYKDFLEWLLRVTDEDTHVAEAQAQAGKQELSSELAADNPARPIDDPYEKVLDDAGGKEAIARNQWLSQRVRRQVDSTFRKYDQGLDRWQHDNIMQCLGFRDLSMHAMRVKKHFDSILDGLVRDINCEQSCKLTCLKAGVKGAVRGEKKCRVRYGGDCSQMSDMVRGTIEVNGTIDDLYMTLDKVVSAPSLNKRSSYVSYFSDRYQNPPGGSYYDLLTLVRIQGMVCELQINLKAAVAVKESPIGHGNYETVRLSNDDLLVATITNDLELARHALQRGAKPAGLSESRNGISVLHFAAYHGNQAMVLDLLEAEADPYAADYHGLIPLHRAVLNCDVRMVELLTQKMNKDLLQERLDKHNGPVLMWCTELASEMDLIGARAFLKAVAIKALEHTEPKVRFAAAQALDKLGDVSTFSDEELDELYLQSLDYLDNAQIQWVSIAYLRQLRASGNCMQSTQKVPRSACKVGSEGIPRARTVDKHRYMVSYGWLSKEHPDPCGAKLQELLSNLDSLQAADDEFVFIDYMSMPQPEDDLFQRAIGGLYNLSTFGQFKCIILPDIPKIAECESQTWTWILTEYLCRGWCFMEFSFGVMFGNICNAGINPKVHELIKTANLDKLATIAGFESAVSSKRFSKEEDRDLCRDLFAKVCFFREDFSQQKESVSREVEAQMISEAFVVHAVPQLAAFAYGSRELRELDLNCVQIPAEVGKEIGTILMQQPKLTILKMRGNKQLFTPKGLNNLLEGIGNSVLKSVCQLDVHGCDIRSDGGKLLGRFLRKCPELSVIVLSCNSQLFTASGLDELKIGLVESMSGEGFEGQHSDSIEDRPNSLAARGFSHLMEADFSNCCIQAHMALQLGLFLQEFPQINTVQLGGNDEFINEQALIDLRTGFGKGSQPQTLRLLNGQTPVPLPG